jgi:hypothetical protein
LIGFEIKIGGSADQRMSISRMIRLTGTPKSHKITGM